MTRTGSKIITALWVLILAGLPLSVIAKDSDQDVKLKKQWEQLYLYRFEFDNDAFQDSDDAFSAGWGLQRHSPAFDTWDEVDRNKLSRWIIRTVPGIGDDGIGGRVVRLGTGFSQVIQTPADITIEEPQLDDVPWAGTLGFHTSWYAVSNKRLNAFQVYIGMLGPSSLAEQVQTFIHDDLGAGDTPEGWDNQLENEPLLNLNYVIKHKLAGSNNVGKRGLAGDISIGGQGAIGNLFSVAEVSLEFRVGWGLPEGFTQIPDPPGRGVMLEPTPQPPSDRWRAYVSIVPREMYLFYTVLNEGNTFRDSPHPGIDYDKTVFQMLYGLHVAKGRFALHLTYYYFPSAILDTPSDSSLEWSNISLEYRW